ncbi:choice-of-anchor J domain-containing protein [Bacillus sp. SM2101]|uniref:choice-of-anchor J domain-containing protein n=1 Tax=Bacillus sp. SM2101 TaxID=2805366 RepID=UPI001BDF5216|nr:choice-of-anchor J domain-containing protein [Bacillus sp. SM2101]
MKKKLVSAVSATALTLSLLTPSLSGAQVSAASKDWNAERYGDVLDIGAKLRAQAEDEGFLKKAREEIAAQVDNINLNGEEVDAENSSEGTFSFDGGTKYFLNQDLQLKTFTLRSVGENVEVWVADDLSFPEGDPRPAHVVTQEQVDKLRDEFDNNIYPVETEFFGQSDFLTGEQAQLPAILDLPEDYYLSEEGKNIMLVDNIVDENFNDPDYPFFTAGFYYSLFETYIDRNIITIDTLDWENRLDGFLGTVAHEYQHLIHDDNDSDEENWINEGMSDYAEYLTGYGHPMGHVNYFLDHPENSLVEWDEFLAAGMAPETLADYGQAYLLQLYLSEQFGQEFIQELIKDEANGIESVNNQLSAFNTGIDFPELFSRFNTALVIDSAQPGDGIYEFESIDLQVNFESAAAFEKDGVPAWGGNFKVIELDDKIRTINFDGIDFLPIPWEVAQDPLGSGNEVLWASEGDEADNFIVLEADLSNVNEATLQFDNYIDIEEQWDFGIVQVSTDGGENWTSLANENTRSDIVTEGYPKIKENLPGFTGHYDDWQKETFDLSDYAGQEILVAFRYMTDWGYNDSGWFIDNIEIPEIDYVHDGNSLDGLKSINEVKGQYVDYAVTFINERAVGKDGKNKKYKVVNVEPFNVNDEDALELRQLFKDGKNYMIIWYAPPAGTKGFVDFTYEIITKSDSKKDKNGN